MRKQIRHFLALWAFMVIGIPHAGIAQAGDFPDKPISLVMSLGPGGSDALFRQFSLVASKELGQPVVVLSKPGAGGTLGAAQMAQTAKPDGYTVAAAFVGLFRQPQLQKVDWDPIRDFTPIIGLGGYTFGVAVLADSPFKTLEEMVAWAKANPRQLTYGSPGPGSSTHLLMEQLAATAGFEANHVPFRGGAQVTEALLGGHIMVNINAVGSQVAQVESGRVRLLAIFDEEPNPQLPGVPTVKESGYDVSGSAPYGLVGPRGMSPELVSKLHDAFKVALFDPASQRLMNSLYDKVIYQSTADYTEWWKSEYDVQRKALEQAALLPRH
ncbi:MAG TPA: tripartite tricarboxylate transporter substrate binding protein [Burkholderiaceae bacterium]|nr:tripartite tricarboxylate transporter substrate binding protein [Burkholderiaceae bacterium]